MHNYIKKIRDQNKEDKLINEFKSHYPDLMIYYSYESPFTAFLNIRTIQGGPRGKFVLSDFDVFETERHIKLKKFVVEYIHVEEIRKIYFNFMKENFEDYVENFKIANTNKKEINSL